MWWLWGPNLPKGGYMVFSGRVVAGVVVVVVGVVAVPVVTFNTFWT